MSDYALWIPVTSSNLHSVRWLGDGLLDIRFLNKKKNGVGRHYRYSGVPLQVFKELLAAGSKGQYHDKNIKWTYAYKRM